MGFPRVSWYFPPKHGQFLRLKLSNASEILGSRTAAKSVAPSFARSGLCSSLLFSMTSSSSPTATCFCGQFHGFHMVPREKQQLKNIWHIEEHVFWSFEADSNRFHQSSLSARLRFKTRFSCSSACWAAAASSRCCWCTWQLSGDSKGTLPFWWSFYIVFVIKKYWESENSQAGTIFGIGTSENTNPKNTQHVFPKKRTTTDIYIIWSNYNIL